MRPRLDALGKETMEGADFVGTSPLDGLYSGLILRAIVQALDIEDEVLDDRTARRFFAGGSVNEHNRNQIFDALGQAMITRGLAPETLEDLPEALPMAAVVGMSLMMSCGQWDHLMAHIQSRSGKIADAGAAGAQCLRLVVVDLALRLFALDYLDLASLPGPEPPAWALENGIGNILRQHLRRAGLTRDQMAARLEVSPKSVDNWLDGKNRPSANSVAALAEELASVGTGRDAGELYRELNRQFSLTSIADLLAAGIGRDRVIELAVKLVYFTRVLSESPELPRLLGDNPRGIARNLLIFGCVGGCAPALLSWLAERELDPSWRRDILAAAAPWELAFESVAMMHTGPRSAAGLAQDISDVSGGTTEEDQYINEALRREASTHADFAVSSPVDENGLELYLTRPRGSLDLRRSLAGRFPQSPNAHYQLGSSLGMMGKNFGDRILVDEGILECKIAAGLLPNWDAPAVEPGIILVNVGEGHAALRELEQAESTLPRPTPHLRFVKGYVLTTLERYSEALECLEAVIKEQPGYASAYDHAAHCAFMSGDKTKGLRYAKQARLLGIPAEQWAWGAGAYSSRPKRV